MDIPVYPIPGHPNYFCDLFGDIWSNKLGRWKKLKRRFNTHGYLSITLSQNGYQKTITAHTLVLLTFKGECPPGMEACHNNGIKTDNRPSNLRWDTRSKNCKDKHKHGTIWKGKLNRLQKRIIRKYPKYYGSQIDLAKYFKVSRHTVIRTLQT